MDRQRHILVIDDDVQLVDTVHTLLESRGYRVSYAYHAGKGMELATKIKPDLIILDILFVAPPGPDGIEAARQLRRDPTLKDTPILMLSGARKLLGMRIKLEPDETYLPVTAFLEKPFKPHDLLAEIEKILGAGPQTTLS